MQPFLPLHRRYLSPCRKSSFLCHIDSILAQPAVSTFGSTSTTPRRTTRGNRCTATVQISKQQKSPRKERYNSSTVESPARRTIVLRYSGTETALAFLKLWTIMYFGKCLFTVYYTGRTATMGTSRAEVLWACTDGPVVYRAGSNRV